jgi:hypothetical protein
VATRNSLQELRENLFRAQAAFDAPVGMLALQPWIAHQNRETRMSEFEGPEKAQFPLPHLAGMEPLHSGMRRAGRVPSHTSPILESSRCDQEAHQDANLIQKALRGQQRAEKALAGERALKLTALFFIPGAFFVGILLSVVIMRAGGLLPDQPYRTFAFGCLIALVAFLAAISSYWGALLLEKVEAKVGRGLW